MESDKRSRLVIISQLLLMLAMVAGLAVSLQSKRSLRQALDREKLHAEALLSEKLLTEKALHKTKRKNAALESDNAMLQRSLDEKEQLAASQQQGNARLRETLTRYQSELGDRRDTIYQLKGKLEDVTARYALEKAQWKAATDSLQHLREEKRSLMNELDAAIAQTIDQPMITALKKSGNKITTRSGAAWKLLAQVEVAATLDNMRFVVEGPEGNDLNGSVTSRVIDDHSKSLTASVRKTVAADIHSKTVEISYQPGEKLKPGVYALKIFNDNRYVGRIKIKLN